MSIENLSSETVAKPQVNELDPVTAAWVKAKFLHNMVSDADRDQLSCGVRTIRRSSIGDARSFLSYSKRRKLGYQECIVIGESGRPELRDEDRDKLASKYRDWLHRPLARDARRRKQLKTSGSKEVTHKATTQTKQKIDFTILNSIRDTISTLKRKHNLSNADFFNFVDILKVASEPLGMVIKHNNTEKEKLS